MSASGVGSDMASQGTPESPVRGLYEAHLPADDLDRAVSFYESLGLRVAYRNERVAFLWTEPERSWLGVWAPDPGVPEHHVAFEVSLAFMKQATAWLRARGVEPREVAGFREPFARPHQPIASAYFADSEGNDAEFMAVLPTEPTDEQAEVPLSAWLRQRSA